MKHLFINIHILAGVGEHPGQKRGKALQDLGIIQDAFLLTNHGLIEDYGEMKSIDFNEYAPAEVHDVSGQCILPCWVDSHTHLVFAGSREDEFVDKLKGLSYAEIAAHGGGILNSAKKMQEMDEDELVKISLHKLNELIKLGTGAIEIKSGYGLTPAAELKMLRVINKLKELSPIPVKASFLGAHTYPVHYREYHDGYINEILTEMLPVIAEQELADYVDVFCETGFFSPEETKTICKEAAKYGMRPKLHVNQLNSIGGIEAGIELNALSLDHLETLTTNDIELLGSFEGGATLLPTAAFFLRMPYQPARALIDAGAAVTLASDYNPGSSPSGNMNFVAALSCIQMKMLPEEVINAGTINGAFALGLQNEVGSISKDKKANFIITTAVPSLAYLFYSFGSNHIAEVWINGEKFHS